MELRHLRHFLSVTEHLNITHASRHLHLSQPALSRQMKELETELGVALFLRKASGLQLTSAGKFLVKEATSTLQRIDLMLRTLSAFAGPTDGRFSVGYDPGAISQWFFRTLARFGSGHPQTELSIREQTTEQLFAALHDGSMDVAILPIAHTAVPPEYESLVIAREPLSLVLSSKHPLAGNSSLRLNQMQDEIMISYQENVGVIWQQFLMDACRLAGFMPEDIVRVSSYSAMLATIAGGKGYSLLPRGLDADLNQAISFIPVSHPVLTMDICAIWRPSSTSTYLPLFLDVLAEGRASIVAIA